MEKVCLGRAEMVDKLEALQACLPESGEKGQACDEDHTEPPFLADFGPEMGSKLRTNAQLCLPLTLPPGVRDGVLLLPGRVRTSTALLKEVPPAA